MAISPKSRGLGNIGNIVNRQGRVSPTRPQPMPVPRLAPTPMAAPSRPNTTTFAQRQASQPFRNFTKPAMPRVDPMAMQPQQPMTPPQPFNPIQGQRPAPQMSMPVERPAPMPFNPQPNPGQMPMNPYFGSDPYIRDMEYKPGRDYMPGGENDPMNSGMFGGMMGPTGQPYQQGLGQMFGAPTVDAGGPAGMQPGNFGNPNPLTSDYDELEGSAFNTNPSMGGSMFGGGGFSGY